MLACYKEDFEVLMLAEERKEELEQLPTPLKIVDPPFENVYLI